MAAQLDLSWAHDHRRLPARPEWRGPLILSLRRRIVTGEAKLADAEHGEEADAICEALADLRAQLARAEAEHQGAWRAFLRRAAERWVAERRQACQLNEVEKLRTVRGQGTRRLATTRPAPARRSSQPRRGGDSGDLSDSDEPGPLRGSGRLDSRAAIDRSLAERYRTLMELGGWPA